MKHVKVLFKHHLTVWSHLLIEAAPQSSPATALLNNNARTQLFYLEGMTRLLASFDNKKTWLKLNESFKELEDALGLIDYFEGFIKDFKSNKTIPSAILTSLNKQKQLAEFKANATLKQQGWLDKNIKPLDRIKKTIKKIDWPDDATFKKNLHGFYAKQIQAIQTQLEKPLLEIESGIHELRRDVRWLSIYPHAFKGFIVLKPRTIVAKKFDKYITTEITDSPFNQLVRADDLDEVLLLNMPNFYAMSWLIAALGTLKDQGLALEILSKEWAALDGINTNQAHTLSLNALGKQQASAEELLLAANTIVQHIKRDGIFNGLLT